MIHAVIQNINLDFNTESLVFSPKAIDLGTLAMLNSVIFNKEDRVLDLGCGYGVVGIFASKVTDGCFVVMSDIDETAIKLSKENVILNDAENIELFQSDGLTNIPYDNFSIILSNPPYHSDFSVAKKFIETGFKKLIKGGKMVMVTKRKEWYKNKLSSVFGGVKIKEENGYFIFIAEKRDYATKKFSKEKSEGYSKKIKRKNRLKYK